MGICILSNYQNKGYGSKTMDFIISKIKELNSNYINKIYLSVDSTNLSAIRLYKKKGFTIINKKISPNTGHAIYTMSLNCF